MAAPTTPQAAGPPPAMDVAVASVREHLRAAGDRGDGCDRWERWGRRVLSPWVVLAVLVVVVLGFAVELAVALALPRSAAWLAPWLAYGVFAALGLVMARAAARAGGGWSRTIGLGAARWPDGGPPRTARRPRWSWRLVGTVVLVVLAARASEVLVVGLYQELTPWADAAPDNTTALSASGPALVSAVVVTVLVAPVVEELIFRGLLLRGVAVRWGWWPAAVSSSLVFGLLHAPGASAGAPSVVLGAGVLGVWLALLARRTGRLAAGMWVHAVFNATTVLAVLAAR